MKRVLVVLVVVGMLVGCPLFPKPDQPMSWVDQTRIILNSAAVGETALYAGFTILCAEATIDAKTCTLGFGLDKEWSTNLALAMEALEKYDKNQLSQADANKVVMQAMTSFSKINALLKEYNAKGAQMKAMKLRGGDLTLPTGKKK